MHLADLIGPEAVIASLKVKNKKQLLQELSARAARLTGLQERYIFDTLLQRERLGSTGLGQGIAIPHAGEHAVSHSADCMRAPSLSGMSSSGSVPPPNSASSTGLRIELNGDNCW